MRIPVAIALIVFIATCGSPMESDVPPTSHPQPASPVYMKACSTGARPQTELDFAGLPPLVPTSSALRCLLNAVSGGAARDGGGQLIGPRSRGRGAPSHQRRGAAPGGGRGG